MIDKNYKAGAQRGSADYDAVITLIATPKGKFPPQAGKIIEALIAAKDNTLTVGELVGTDGSTESALENAGLKTVQTAAVIWTHYKARLVEEGLVSVS
tara:strand:+ start:221 stop:514 length:294 start_codon:yes stop_codon:yes gene_type:complete